MMKACVFPMLIAPVFVSLAISAGKGEPPTIYFLGEEPSGRFMPVERDAVRQGKAVLVNDFASSDYQPPHSGICSSLVVPIAYQQTLAGLIHLHDRSPAHFDEATQEIIQTLAVQAAIALGNTRRFQDQVSAE